MKKVIWGFLVFLVFLILASPAYHRKYKFTKSEICKIQQYEPGLCYVYESDKDTDSIFISENSISEPRNTFGFDYEGSPFHQFNVGDREASLIISGTLHHNVTESEFTIIASKRSNFKPLEVLLYLGLYEYNFKATRNQDKIILRPFLTKKIISRIHTHMKDKTHESCKLKIDYVLLDNDWTIIEYRLEGEDNIFRLKDIAKQAI